MKTPKKFIEERIKTPVNPDSDCEYTWDEMFDWMQAYGDYREQHAPLPQSIQEALNSGDGTYRP